MDFDDFKAMVERIDDKADTAERWNKPLPGRHASTGSMDGFLTKWSLCSVSEWDGNSSVSVSGDRPEHLQSLVEILREIRPETTFLEYLELQKIVRYDTFEDGGYYGSSYEGIAYVTLKDLYGFLDDKGFLPDVDPGHDAPPPAP